MTDQQPWGEVALEPGVSVERTLGTLHLTVKRTRNEIWLSSERGTRDGDADVDWERWAVPENARLHLRPAAPDRLLVVAHEHPFHLPGRTSARLFLRLPVFVQAFVSSPDIEDLVVLDQPSMVLSDTWWGDVQEGEIAYWLTTKARAEITDDLFVPHLAMCPVQLENESGEALPVDRFSVRALHLSLFQSGPRIWTDEVKVTYLAAEEGSAIEFGGNSPADEPEGQLISEPRVPVRRGLKARTFDRLRSLSMLGG